jgi:hypothetical protein
VSVWIVLPGPAARDGWITADSTAPEVVIKGGGSEDASDAEGRTAIGIVSELVGSGAGAVAGAVVVASVACDTTASAADTGLLISTGLLGPATAA